MVTKKVTSLEVAKLAGVSQSAVSRVFTPGASASKKINEKGLAYKTFLFFFYGF